MDERALADTQESRVRAGPRYGILGGTFDPPHLGHLVLAQEVHARLGLDRVWFLPAGVPPHKTGRAVSPAADRHEMVQRAIADDERFALSAVELTRPGPSYTADTLEQLREQWGRHAVLHLILGWDMLMYLPNWHAPERVLAALRAKRNAKSLNMTEGVDPTAPARFREHGGSLCFNGKGPERHALDPARYGTSTSMRGAD